MFLHYRGDELYLEEVSLQKIADAYGTPCYVYSYQTLLDRWQAFKQAFAGLPHLICYAVKANSNINILHIFAKQQAGFDIVSLGELERVLKAGGDPQKIIFSGVGKRQDELKQALLKNIYCFNIESQAELERLNQIASELNQTAHIALRINPNIDPKTHAHISTGLAENKFGIDSADILPLCHQLSQFPALKFLGIACHIGSQITDLQPFLQSLDTLAFLYRELSAIGIKLKHIDIGGGLGIVYRNENPPSIEAYAKAVKDKLGPLNVQIMLEPGRALVGDAGILLTRVEYLKQNKHQHFAIVDAGMNDLLRPALYDAWQEILPVQKRQSPPQSYHIAGPVCESADFLGKERKLAILAGDILAVKSAGAYGFSMSSNYNSRCRPAEVLVHHEEVKIIRRRESLDELFAAENLIW